MLETAKKEMFSQNTTSLFHFVSHHVYWFEILEDMTLFTLFWNTG